MYVRIFINNENELENLAYHPNIRVRACFMKSLIDGHARKLRKFYPNITDYLVNKNESGEILEIMDEQSLSEICAGILDVVYDEEMFRSLKDFILEHYSKNHLLNFIYNVAPSKSEDDLFNTNKEIMRDIKRLYQTSCDYKLEYLNNCRENIPEPLRLKVESVLKHFYYESGEILEEIFKNELGDDFIHLVNKYLGISSSQEIKSHKIGTYSKTFIVGDFLIKYIRNYHSVYGDSYKCPSNFLINRVYDEIIRRDSNGNFLGCLQVQARLDIPLSEDQKDIIELFNQELANIGYFCDDLLVGFGRENVFRLHDYHDADCVDPESLPEWFKKNPYVLVDRDCVYELIDKKNVEELKSRIFAFPKQTFRAF